MKPLHILVLAAVLPLAALAQTASELVIQPAGEVTLAGLQFVKRPLVVFADTPNDPNFIRQMELLARDPAPLAERDVVVITDTDPAAASDPRRRLRPHGFSIVVLDKDGTVQMRKPQPWDVREISRTIDRSPLRRQEVLERNPSGR